MKLLTLMLLASFALAGCAGSKTTVNEDEHSASSGTAVSDEEMAAIDRTDMHDPANYSADSGQGYQERMPSSKKHSKQKKKKKKTKHAH